VFPGSPLKMTNDLDPEPGKHQRTTQRDRKSEILNKIVANYVSIFNFWGGILSTMYTYNYVYVYMYIIYICIYIYMYSWIWSWTSPSEEQLAIPSSRSVPSGWVGDTKSPWQQPLRDLYKGRWPLTSANGGSPCGAMEKIQGFLMVLKQGNHPLGGWATWNWWSFENNEVGMTKPSISWNFYKSNDIFFWETM